jgi:hypothetical protein
MAFKKKLYKLRPGRGAENAEQFTQSQYTRARTRRERSDDASIERGVRQLLADKVSGHLVGVWLLVAEHLRLGTWDLLEGWTGKVENARRTGATRPSCPRPIAMRCNC